MKKIVIHIGQPKTGTTTLQKALLRNRKELEKQGFIYPRPKFGINHSQLTIPFSKNIQRSMVIHVGNNYKKARKESIEIWRDTIAQFSGSTFHTLLLSSEFLFSSRRLENLPDFIRENFDFRGEIELFAYMRTPSEHYVSLIQQHLKASGKICPLPAINLERLKLLSSIAKLRIRKFSKSGLIDNDITSDFCYHNKIDCAKFSRTTKKANVSLCAEGMILLQEYRKNNHADKQNIFTEDTKKLINLISSEQTQYPGRYTKPSLKPEFSKILDGPTPTHLWLKEIHGVDLTKRYPFAPSFSRNVKDVEDISDLIYYDHNALKNLRRIVGMQ
ncbi:hypothetical protein [Paracoccus indicus]|uniref:hypothetical protein n=1 Tax=Paracoccus indicus TaxID=2079229 RepID=UPI0013B44C81|nr:hypothetical protein [Paracoccus indicus]